MLHPQLTGVRINLGFAAGCPPRPGFGQKRGLGYSDNDNQRDNPSVRAYLVGVAWPKYGWDQYICSAMRQIISREHRSLAPDDDQALQDLAVGLVPLLTPTLADQFEMFKSALNLYFSEKEGRPGFP